MRLQRAGQRHKPFYRIVTCLRKAPRDGKHFEVVGTYNPIPDIDGNKQVTLNVERIKHWLCHGAEPSERVAKLLDLAELCPPPPRRYVAKQVTAGMGDALADEVARLQVAAEGSAAAEGADGEPDGGGATAADGEADEPAR